MALKVGTLKSELQVLVTVEEAQENKALFAGAPERTETLANLFPIPYFR